MLTPAAATRISTVSLPTEGTSRCWGTRTSGGPGSRMPIADIVVGMLIGVFLSIIRIIRARLQWSQAPVEPGSMRTWLHWSLAPFAGLCGFDDAAADLVALERFEERLEVAFAEAFVALALDEFEEDRAELRLREDLQQQPLRPLRRAIHQDAAHLQLVGV